MSYRDALKSLTESVDGALAAVIMGYDGISIDEYMPGGLPFDPQLVAVEYANLLRDIRRTVDLLENGTMEEVAIATDRVRVLVRVINADFFLVLIMSSGGNFGKGRYLICRESLRLKGELG